MNIDKVGHILPGGGWDTSGRGGSKKTSADSGGGGGVAGATGGGGGGGVAGATGGGGGGVVGATCPLGWGIPLAPSALLKDQTTCSSPASRRSVPTSPSKIWPKLIFPSQWSLSFLNQESGGLFSEIHLPSPHPLDSSAHPAEAKEEAEEAAESLPSGTAGSCTGSGIRGGLLGGWGGVGWHEEGGGLC